MAVAVIKSDGWIESIDTKSGYQSYFEDQKNGGINKDLFNPDIYRRRFYNQKTFMELMVALNKVVMLQKPMNVACKVVCNQCDGHNNKYCHRTCRIVPYKDSRVIVYTSVAPGSCSTFDKINGIAV